MTTPTLTSDQIKALIGPNAEYPTKPQPDHLWRLEDIQKRLERIEQMLVGAPTPMLDEATAYAKRLLVSLMDKHFPDRHPEWAPLPDLLGILTQIDIRSLVFEGRNRADIAAGINDITARQILHLVYDLGVEEDIGITGGIAKNVGLVKCLERGLGTEAVSFPEDPQLMGAIGAALFAADRARKRIN